MAILVAAYLLTSQYYFSSSGSVQPSHLPVIVGLLLLGTQASPISGDRFARAKLGTWMAFVAYTVVVNLVYGLYYSDLEFARSSLFYVFDISLAVMTYLALRAGAVRLIRLALAVSLLSCYGFLLSGLGRYNFAPRYNGFFNDPNQMALWLLIGLSSLVLLQKADKPSIAVDMAAVVTFPSIAATQSRSALLGAGLVCSAYLAARYVSLSSKARRTFLLGTCGTVVLVLLLDISLSHFIGRNNGLERVRSAEFGNEVAVRGLLRIGEYPQYLVFGAGQGLDERFGTVNEVHSTWAGILFYYGVAGFLLLVTPMLSLLRNMSGAERMAFLSPLIYSATTFGARTPIFWFFLAVALSCASRSRRPLCLSSTGGTHMIPHLQTTG